MPWFVSEERTARHFIAMGVVHLKGVRPREDAGEWHVAHLEIWEPSHTARVARLIFCINAGA
jgi:hypothetical protein